MEYLLMGLTGLVLGGVCYFIYTRRKKDDIKAPNRKPRPNRPDKEEENRNR